MRWLRHNNDDRPEWLVIGLGNPGSEYASTRHNVGFWALNRLARTHGIDMKAKGKLAATGEGEIEGARVVLAKPRTFVNLSGPVVREIAGRYHVPPERVIVVCDDLDLPVARVRVRMGGGHGGHNGMRSIVGAIGQDFPRIRIGIGRPLVNGEPTWNPEMIAQYVLADPPVSERQELDEAVATAGDAVETIVREGIEAAMNRVNR